MHLERLTLIPEIVGHKGGAAVVDICAHPDLPEASAYRLVQALDERPHHAGSCPRAIAAFSRDDM